MNKNVKTIFILVLTTIILLAFNKAFAAFSLSITPYAGGYDLNYGKINGLEPRINKEVVVNINCDIGKQYRLIQSLLEPLTNIQGTSIPQNNLLVYGIRGTNKYGTLAVEEEVPVSFGRMFIYTSNQSGLSDSFTLVYGLEGPFNVPAGIYRGRLSFTLEPIDTAQAPVSVILNISAEIAIESKIEITTATGTKTITLNPTREEMKSADVLIDIKGAMGSQFKIIQVMNEAPVSSEGYRLSEDAIKLYVKDARKGIGITLPTSLSCGPQTIYTSGISGEAEAFIVNYSLGDLGKEKAGKYRTAIKYLLEGSGYLKEGLIDTLALEIENAPIFDLIISPEAGGLIQFKNLRAFSPPQINEVVIQVKTNIGKPYQVSQKVLSGFTSKEGDVIPEKYFKLKEEEIDTKGILKYPAKTEAKVGDTALFVSDKEGSPDSFKVIYELSIPADLKAGDYSTGITYTLSEI
jgi:hypothetical protein